MSTSTSTPTDSPTFTATKTSTDTRTETPTYSYTMTVTDTRTQTITLTPTDTRTETVTYTFTLTATDSRTMTVTLTPTDSRTPSPTSTETNTYTYTRTATDTRTETVTLTPTDTRTPTPTYSFTSISTSTDTPTATPSNTFTATPTATLTPLTYPYILSVEVYNEAGEKVKVVAQNMINMPILDFIAMTGNAATSVFNPADEDLTLRFNGIWTGEQINVPYVDFAWDGTSSNGQNVSQGVYYIKAIVVDNYGHTNTMIKEIQLIRIEEYVRISIYNSSGELVRRMEQSVVAGAKLNLEVEDVFYVNGGNNITTIKLGPAGSMQWDGKNSFGSLVSSGMYEVSVEVKDDTGYMVFSRKSITVLNERSGPILNDLKFYPNPVIADEDSVAVMRIQWAGTATGKVTIRVYNVAGELAARIDAKLEDLIIDWNMTAINGSKLSAGIYVALVEASTRQGETERAVIKLAIMRK
jgi:hypothetical protein